LDDFLEEHNVDNVDIIRMDIEGFEVEAIKGMAKTIENSTPPLSMILEVHGGLFANPRETLEPMLSHLLSARFKPSVFFHWYGKQQDIDSSNLIDKVCSADNWACHLIMDKTD
jgi:hypothetical protein